MIVLTFHLLLVVGEIALRAHLFIFQTRVHIVPEHSADSWAEDGLKLRSGVGPQFVTVVDVIPMTHNLVGFGGRDIPFGREKEVQESAHSECSGGVCGQPQSECLRGWCVGWELFVVVQRQR